MSQLTTVVEARFSKLHGDLPAPPRRISGRSLYAPEMHDPELVIRPGGEKRLSNFLTWQVADAWLVFSDEMWPEFSRESFEAAIEECRETRAR
jgi:undecaprenyl diphosphate synthase